MASIRKLKNDINYLAFELLTEAFTMKHFYPGIKKDEFDGTIKDIVALRNELITRLNTVPKDAERTAVRAHFKPVYEGMVKMAESLKKLGK